MAAVLSTSVSIALAQAPIQGPASQLAPAPTVQLVQSPEILPDGRVTFRLAAPDALKVEVRGNFPSGFEPSIVPMTKDANGVWSVTVGPLKVKIMTLPPNPSVRTNELAPGSQSPYGMATASFLPDKDVAIASVAFFTQSADEPILVAKDLHAKGNASSLNGGIEDGRPFPGNVKDGFSHRVKYGFTPPLNRKITIKVRYYEVGSLVERRCVISTGLSP